MKSLDNEQLAALINSVSEAVDKTTEGTIADAVAPLREYVEPNCYVGQGHLMDDSDYGYRIQMMWYAGQLLSMVDNGQLYGINSWINCTEKFTMRKSDWEALQTTWKNSAPEASDDLLVEDVEKAE